MTESYGIEPEPAPAAAPESPGPPPRIEDARYCVGCGYELRGLLMDARCPECGTPVAQSLAGDLLRYRPDHHLARLERGALLVLVSAIAQVVAIVALLVLGIVYAAMTQGPPPGVTGALFHWGGFAFEIASALGWFLLSAPEPGYVGLDTGSKARKVVRVAVLVSVAGSLAAVVLVSIFGSTVVPIRGGAVRVSSDPSSLITGVAGIVAFFAQMLYLRWLARRIPDLALEEKAKRFMWLGPVLMTVGACIVIGPFVAWIMFLLMIDRLRRDLATVRWDRRTAGLEAMVAAEGG